MTENDRDLNDRNSRYNETDRHPRTQVSGRFHLWMSLLIIIRQTPCSLSHAARYSERSSDSGQNADGYLQNCFPSVHNFKMLSVKC